MQARNVRSSDCQQVLAVINDWRGGRNMADMLPTLFFDHFQNTSFIVEEDGQMVAFLIGFVSQSQAEESYILSGCIRNFANTALPIACTTSF